MKKLKKHYRLLHEHQLSELSKMTKKQFDNAIKLAKTIPSMNVKRLKQLRRYLKKD